MELIKLFLKPIFKKNRAITFEYNQEVGHYAEVDRCTTCFSMLNRKVDFKNGSCKYQCGYCKVPCKYIFCFLFWNKLRKKHSPNNVRYKWLDIHTPLCYSCFKKSNLWTVLKLILKKKEFSIILKELNRLFWNQSFFL